MKMRSKILISPLMAVALMVVLGLVIYFNLTWAQDDFDHLDRYKMERMATANTARSELLEANVAVYLLFSWIANFDEERIRKETEAINAGIDSASKRFAALGESNTMSEITAASVEQSLGIEQVNQAITQMDEVMQQKAALVEEAAAAEALEEQGQNLSVAVATFKVDEGAVVATRNAPAVARKQAVRPVAKHAAQARPGVRKAAADMRGTRRANGPSPRLWFPAGMDALRYL